MNNEQHEKEQDEDSDAGEAHDGMEQEMLEQLGEGESEFCCKFWRPVHARNGQSGQRWMYTFL